MSPRTPCHPLVDVGGAQPVEHRRADVDPRDVVAEGGERDRQPAGADGQLEDPRRSPGDQRVEERDGRRHVADVGEQLVVDVGDPLAVRLRLGTPPSSRHSHAANRSLRSIAVLGGVRSGIGDGGRPDAICRIESAAVIWRRCRRRDSPRRCRRRARTGRRGRTARRSGPARRGAAARASRHAGRRRSSRDRCPVGRPVGARLDEHVTVDRSVDPCRRVDVEPVVEQFALVADHDRGRRRGRRRGRSASGRRRGVRDPCAGRR